MKRALVPLAACATLFVASAQTKTTVNFWIGGNPQDATFLQKRIAEFERVNPTVAVRLQVLPNDQYLTAVNLAFRGGTPPDLFRAGGFSSPRLEDFAALGWLLPLDRFITTEVINRFPAATIIEGTVKFGGRIYSLPGFKPGVNNMGFLYYNKKLFREAGLVNPPATWEQVRAHARKLTEVGRGRSYGWAMQPRNPPSTYAGYLSTAAAKGFVGEPHPALDYTTGRYNAAHPGQAAAVEFLRKLNLEDKAVIPGWEGMNQDTMEAAFAQGRVGMMLGFAFYAGDFYSRYKMTPDDLGIAPMPTETGRRVVKLPRGPAVGNLSISSRTKVANEAWRLMDFLHSAANDEVALMEMGTVPTVKLPATTLAKGPFTSAALSSITDVQGVTRPDPRIRNPQWVKVLENFKAPQPQLFEIHAQYIQGQINDYAAAARRYDEAWNAELDRAIAEAQKGGAKVCREVLLFNGYDGIKNFGQRDYNALPGCK